MKSCQRMCLEISVDSNNDVLHAKDRQGLYQLTRPDCPCIHGWTPTTVNESVVIGPYRMFGLAEYVPEDCALKGSGLGGRGGGRRYCPDSEEILLRGLPWTIGTVRFVGDLERRGGGIGGC